MQSPKELKLVQGKLRQAAMGSFITVLRSLIETNRNAFTDPDTLLGLLRARDWTRLYALADSMSSTVYDDAASHFAANQFSALLRKYPFTPQQLPAFNPENTAVKKFLRAEYRCKWVNRRIALSRETWSDHSRVMQHARDWIRWVLGDKPDLPRIYELCGFGPGASIGVHGNATNFGRKALASEWTVSPGASPYARAAMWSNFHMRELILSEGQPIICHDRQKFDEIYDKRVRMVSHNKITFVPKTAKTYRSIAIEPLLNGYLQKGVDQYMRSCLRRKAKIDLRYQEPNQHLASVGSLGGFNALCTIDLSAASDSLTTELVRDLVPPDWFELLNSLRSHNYVIGDSASRRYHKFVSMGNGFCFPLETLIFASLAHACNVVNSAPGVFRVYGDDIICNQSVALHLLEVLRWCGFRHNEEKTFIFGPFRESCGEDWFEGEQVRPVYLDEELGSLQSLHVLHNSSLRNRRASLFWSHTRDLIRSLVPDRWTFVRPIAGSADTAFTVPLDVCMQSCNVKWHRFEQRWSYREVLSTSVRDHLRHDLQHHVEYLAVLQGSRSEQPLSLRRSTRTRVRYV